MTTPALRRARSLARALLRVATAAALVAGTNAVSATSATAAVDAGIVRSRLSTAEGIVVRSTVGPAAEQNFLGVQATGTLYAACFSGDGRTAPRTTTSLGSITLGNSRLGPGNNPGYYHFAVLDPNAVSATVDVEISRTLLIRNEPSLTARLDCPSGSSAALSYLQLRTFRADRWVMETGEHIGTYSAKTSARYEFGTGPGLSSTVRSTSPGGAGFVISSTMAPSNVRTWTASRVSGELTAACYRDSGTVVRGSVTPWGSTSWGQTDEGPGNDPSLYPFTVTEPTARAVTADYGLSLAVLTRDGQTIANGLSCPRGTTPDLYAFTLTKVKSVRHKMDGTEVTRFSGKANGATYRFRT